MPDKILEITRSEFVKSAVAKADFLNDLPEIAVAGRSNVGKSSFLNFICGRRKLMNTSRTPGKTREINYFRINNRFYFVDIPGFGYAKLSRDMKDELSRRIEAYFNYSTTLAGIIYLLDIRLKFSETDMQALEWLTSFDRPILIAATKSDKIKPSQMQDALRNLSDAYSLPVPPIATSALKKKGRDEILSQLSELLG